MKFLHPLQELIFPSRCLGCGALGIEICSQCRASWHPHIYRTWSREAPHFPIYSSIQYSKIAGKVLLSAKETSLLHADQLMLNALSHSLRKCREEHGLGSLVPIPSRKSVARLRGRQFIYELTKEIGSREKLPVSNILTHTRKVRDQSNLDAVARIDNLQGALLSLRYLSGKVFLVDDLVTTGATLAEAARALRAKGIDVAAAVTACVAEPLR